MKLYRVILPVGDIEDAVNFYGGIFDQNGTRVSPGRHYFDLEGTILACYDAIADGDDNAPVWKQHENQYLYFSTDHLEHAFVRVKQLGATYCDDQISKMPWGERLFYANDPWGNPICFVDRTTIFVG